MVAKTILEPVRKLMSVGMRRMHSSQGEGINLVLFHRLLLSCIEANMESKVTSHRTRGTCVILGVKGCAVVAKTILEPVRELMSVEIRRMHPKVKDKIGRAHV